MRKYLANIFDPRIEPINVDRESDACVWINGRRKNKVSTDEIIFDSWDEAKAWLLQRAEKKLNSARRQLERAQGEYGNVKGMKPPQEREQ